MAFTPTSQLLGTILYLYSKLKAVHELMQKNKKDLGAFKIFHVESVSLASQFDLKAFHNSLIMQENT